MIDLYVLYGCNVILRKTSEAKRLTDATAPAKPPPSHEQLVKALRGLYDSEQKAVAAAWRALNLEQT